MTDRVEDTPQLSKEGPITRTNKTDINSILLYSARKNKANPDLLYSVLNPETSSDSPSDKSNGVRFVSAKQVTNQTPAIGGKIKINHEKV